MNWLVLSFALASGFVSGYDATVIDAGVGYELTVPSDAVFVDMSIEATILSHVRLWGNAETYMTPIGIASFNPYRADYGIGAALYWGIFEIGVKHECDHGVSARVWRPYYASGETQVYIKISSSIEL